MNNLSIGSAMEWNCCRLPHVTFKSIYNGHYCCLPACMAIRFLYFITQIYLHIYRLLTVQWIIAGRLI